MQTVDKNRMIIAFCFVTVCLCMHLSVDMYMYTRLEISLYAYKRVVFIYVQNNSFGCCLFAKVSVELCGALCSAVIRIVCVCVCFPCFLSFSMNV